MTQDKSVQRAAKQRCDLLAVTLTVTHTNRSPPIQQALVYHLPTERNENTTLLAAQQRSFAIHVLCTWPGKATQKQFELFLRGIAGPRNIGQFDSYPWLPEASGDDGAHGTQQQAQTKFHHLQISTVSTHSFPRASERRVLLIVGVYYTSSHLHIFTSSHLHIFTSSHLLSLSLSLSCRLSLAVSLLPSLCLALSLSCPLSVLPSLCLALSLSCPLSVLPSSLSFFFYSILFQGGRQRRRGATEWPPFRTK